MASLVALLGDLPIQLGHIVAARLPAILEIADIGLEGRRGEAAGTRMDNVVLGRKVLGHQSPDRVPVSAFFLLRSERPLGIDCCWRLSHRDHTIRRRWVRNT